MEDAQQFYQEHQGEGGLDGLDGWYFSQVEEGGSLSLETTNLKPIAQ